MLFDDRTPAGAMVEVMETFRSVKLRSGPPPYGGIYGMGAISLALLVAILVFVP